MDIRLFVIIFGRHELNRAFIRHVVKLRKETGLALPLSLCYSTKEDYNGIKPLLSGVDHVFRYENKPIGKKLNAFAADMLSKTSNEYYMQIGSDDFIKADYFEHLKTIDLPDVGGVNKMYIHNAYNHESIKYEYKNKVFKTLGACRIYKRNVLDMCYKELYKHSSGRTFNTYEKIGKAKRFRKIKGYRKFELWNNTLNSGLDNSAELALKDLKINTKVIYDGYAFTYVKALDNIHQFSEFKGESVSEDEALGFTDIDYK